MAQSEMYIGNKWDRLHFNWKFMADLNLFYNCKETTIKLGGNFKCFLQRTEILKKIIPLRVAFQIKNRIFNDIDQKGGRGSEQKPNFIRTMKWWQVGKGGGVRRRCHNIYFAKSLWIVAFMRPKYVKRWRVFDLFHVWTIFFIHVKRQSINLLWF